MARGRAKDESGLQLALYRIEAGKCLQGFLLAEQLERDELRCHHGEKDEDPAGDGEEFRPAVLFAWFFPVEGRHELVFVEVLRLNDHEEPVHRDEDENRKRLPERTRVIPQPPESQTLARKVQ